MTHLQQLITSAHKLVYIHVGINEFSQSLREFRNIVHVRNQLRTGHDPDRDIARVCWWVVVAALNDLAASAPK